MKNNKIQSTALILSVFIALFLSSCDKTDDAVVESSVPEYSVKEVAVPKSFSYSAEDSLLTAKITITNPQTVSGVKIEMLYYDASFGVSPSSLENIEANETETVYEAKFPMSYLYPNGNYFVNFFVNDNVNVDTWNTKQVASVKTFYSNGQENLPPSVSDLKMYYVGTEPALLDTLDKNREFKFTVYVSDPNGSIDVERVVYRLYDPNGNLIVNNDGVSEFPLSDLGDTEASGDEVADDNIYTNKLTFPISVDSGNWGFEFFAEDKGGLTSIPILHSVYLNK